MGQVPVLEIDGKKYNQSRAIGRYLAKKCKLYGSDEIDALEIDIVIDSIEDIRQGEKRNCGCSCNVQCATTRTQRSRLAIT